MAKVKAYTRKDGTRVKGHTRAKVFRANRTKRKLINQLLSSGLEERRNSKAAIVRQIGEKRYDSLLRRLNVIERHTM